MNAKRFVVAMTLIGAVVAGLAVKAEADCVAWMPYAAALRYTAADAGSPWGTRTSALFKYIHDDTETNPVWNAESTYYQGGNDSWFAANNGDKNWTIYIHNPSNSSTITVDLQYYDSFGQIVDENRYWQYPGNVSEGEGEDISRQLVNTSPSAPLQWSNANNKWTATVAANSTVIINTWGTASSNPMFTDPGTSVSRQFGGSVRLSSSSDFLCEMWGKNYFHPRKNSTQFRTEQVMSYSWSYAGVYEAQYTGSLHRLILPFCRDERISSSSSPDYATWIRVVNTSGSNDNFRIKVHRIDNAILSASPDDIYTTEDIASGASFTFMPSRFYNPSGVPSDTRGYVAIEGVRPVAIALMFRFPKVIDGASTISDSGEGENFPGEYPRLPCASSMDFFVMEEGEGL